MNKECDTIRDLMPLVLDAVASENSKNMVTRHVEDCKECREYTNQEAARMLRRKKRTRNLRLLLLGILIASVVFCTGLFVWHRMVNLTEPLSLEQYQLNLYQLEDGNIYVTADLYDYRKTGIVYSEQYVERSLYLSLQTHPYEKDTMIQMETGNFGVICLDDYDSIYQGTPDGYKLVWQRGQKISSASTWMELYYFWYIAGERLDSKMIDGDDGKLTYASVEDESRANWIQSQESYYYMRVPEFAPISTSRFTTIQNEADENRIRWMLEGVPGIEEKDILRLFELMNQVQDEMNNSQI